MYVFIQNDLNKASIYEKKIITLKFRIFFDLSNLFLNLKSFEAMFIITNLLE